MFWRVFWQFVKSFQQPFIICGCGYWVTGEINWAETLVLVSNNFFWGLNHDVLSFWSDPIWIMIYDYFLSDLIRSESWCTSTFFLIWSDLNHDVRVLCFWSDYLSKIGLLSFHALSLENQALSIGSSKLVINFFLIFYQIEFGSNSCFCNRYFCSIWFMMD